MVLCRLYGHQWRHPGEYEVLVSDRTDRPSMYPFECAVCGTEMVSDLGRQPVQSDDDTRDFVVQSLDDDASQSLDDDARDGDARSIDEQ